MTDLRAAKLVRGLESGDITVTDFLEQLESALDAAGSAVTSPLDEPATVQRATAGVRKIERL